MPDDVDLELQKKLDQEREKVRLNSIKMLKLLGWKTDPSKMTQEQLDARIELQTELKNNQTKDPKTPTPTIFKGIDEERENKEIAESSTIMEFEEIVGGYDALTAQIPQLRNNANVGHFEGFAKRENIRIMRLPASIKLDDNHSILRRVLL